MGLRRALLMLLLSRRRLVPARVAPEAPNSTRSKASSCISIFCQEPRRASRSPLRRRVSPWSMGDLSAERFFDYTQWHYEHSRGSAFLFRVAAVDPDRLVDRSRAEPRAPRLR